MQDRRENDHWSFDKKIPIALIFTMLFQLGAGTWWVSALNSRVGELEKGAEKVIIKTAASAEEMLNVKERVLKLEITLTNINSKLDEIKELIKRK